MAELGPGEGTPQEGAEPSPDKGSGETPQLSASEANDAKRLEDLTQQLNNERSRADKAENASAKIQTELLEKLANNQLQNSQPAAPTPEDYQAELARMAKAMDDGGSEATVEILFKLQEDAEKRTAAALKEQAESFTSQFGVLSEGLKTVDPSFQAIKADVDALKVKYPDMGRDTLVAMATEIRAVKKPDQPDVPDLAGNSGSSPSGAAPQGGITDLQFADLEASLGTKLSDDVRAQMRQKHGG